MHAEPNRILTQQRLRLVGHHARSVVRGLQLPEGSIIPSLTLCQVCSRPVEKMWPRCYKCNVVWREYGTNAADAVVPLSYAVKNRSELQQFYYDLFQYKGEPASSPAQNRLYALLGLFEMYHLSCLERSAGRRVDQVVTVPSGRGRSDHPLPRIAQALERPILAAKFVGAPRGGRAVGVRPSDFAIQGGVGRHVVVLEDTWVSGANAQSLAIQAKAAGAEYVSIVVLARLLDYSQDITGQLVDSWSPDVAWSYVPCPVLGAGCLA